MGYFVWYRYIALFFKLFLRLFLQEFIPDLFKQDAAGQAAFVRFMQSVGFKKA